MQKPEVSIIIPALNESLNLARTLSSLEKNTRDMPIEIVILNDGSTDGFNYSSFMSRSGKFPITVINTPGLGLARAKNYGARESKGKKLVFVDAHMDFQPNWLDNMLQTSEKNPESIITCAISDMRDRSAKGYGFEFNSWELGMSWLGKKSDSPYEIPLAGGAFMMLERKFFNNIGGFDEGMIKWGREDSEISFRSWILGHSVVIDPRVEIAHLFRKTFPYKVENSHVNNNVLRFAHVHFNHDRIKNVKEFMQKSCELPAADISDFEKRRELIDMMRAYSDDWFFEKFRMNFA